MSQTEMSPCLCYRSLMVRVMIGEQCGRLHEDKIWGNRNPEWPRGSMNGVTACFLLSLICQTFPVPQPPRNGRSIGAARRTLPQGGLAEAAIAGHAPEYVPPII